MIAEVVEKYYLELWGPPSRTARFRRGERSIEIYKWDADVNPEGVTVYATLGASAYALVGDTPPEHRVEFFTGLKPAQDEIASPLAALALYAFEEHTLVAHGHTVPAGKPLWPGTEMNTFLVLRPVMAIIRPMRLPDGLHIDFLQAIPVYDSEVVSKSTHQAEGLLARWREAGVPFWDPNRLPEPR